MTVQPLSAEERRDIALRARAGVLPNLPVALARFEATVRALEERAAGPAAEEDRARRALAAIARAHRAHTTGRTSHIQYVAAVAAAPDPREDLTADDKTAGGRDGPHVRCHPTNGSDLSTFV